MTAEGCDVEAKHNWYRKVVMLSFLPTAMGAVFLLLYLATSSTIFMLPSILFFAGILPLLHGLIGMRMTRDKTYSR